MSVVFEQVIILFTFVIIGYFLSKKKIINCEHSKLLSALVVYIFLPCKVFNTFSVNFTTEYISKNYLLLIISLIVLIGVLIMARFVSKLFSDDPYKRNVYRYMLIVPNFGYMGYALAEMLYGNEFLLDVIVFGLPVSIYTNTIGFCMLTKTEISLKKLIQPVIIAIIFGAVFGWVGIKIPNALRQVLDKASGCMAPICMLLTGIAISEFRIKDLLSDKKAYIISILRLFIIPCVIALILKQFCSPEIVLLSIMIYAMPCGLNTVVFPKLVGESCETGAGAACISAVLACITIPVCVGLFGI